MKKIFTLCVACLAFLSVYAQQENTPEKKYDTVKMKSGETKVGSVTDITDDVIRFVHKGETLNYSLKKNDIEKIIFSSGRVEMYNDPSTNKRADTSNAEHRNKVAVLPFSYINNQQRDDPEMGVQGTRRMLYFFKQ